MIAVEIVEDDKVNTPNKEMTGKIAKYANENGLILLSAGIYGNVITFLMPFVINDEELNKGFSIFSESFEKAGK